MTDYNDDDNQTNSGGQLRKQYEDTLAKLKESNERLAQFEARERIRSVESALSEKGLNPKLAKFVPAEDGSDPERLNAWIKDNSEIFGTPSPSGSTTGNVEEPSGASPVTPDQQEAFGKIVKVSGEGANQVVDLAALQAQMKAAKDPAEFEQIMSQYRLA